MSKAEALLIARRREDLGAVESLKGHVLKTEKTPTGLKVWFDDESIWWGSYMKEIVNE